MPNYSDPHEPQYDYVFVKVIKKAKKSALCELLDYDDEKLWIPYSVMETEGKHLSEGDEEDLSVETWFLKKHDIGGD